ncbi:NAD-dependent epimerase/dehydratase family protein [Frigidibacter oleivorans]|uniref:NAD-dependent epimerase/dehydratase family protein n=1 Tax=Frigidibacter oleivorans TaxID=2487129 RepID=UPI000F8CFFC4|nr:NAD(P)-dependent oxidoreductase [Frigidibacter oleivorans]
MARVLITGGTGFIGSHLARACVARGDAVTVLARPGSDPWRLADIRPRLRLVEAAPDDAAAIAACLTSARPEAIFHLGATSRFPAAGPDALREACRVNLLPLLALAGAAARLSSPPAILVRAGTIAEYGRAPQPFAEDGREAPVTAHGWSALAGTQALAAMSADLPFATVTARLGLTYGATQSGDFLIPMLVRACLRCEMSRIRTPGQRRDLLNVDDAVAGLLRIADLPGTAPPVVNLCSGNAPTMAEVGAAVLRATNAPAGLIACDPPTGPDEPRLDLRSDPSLAARTLGWRAQIGLEAGLAQMVAEERAPEWSRDRPQDRPHERPQHRSQADRRSRDEDLQGTRGEPGKAVAT